MAFGDIRPQRSYPFRAGAPDGQAVLSDQEWTQNWQERLDSVPRTLGGRRTSTELVAGAPGYNPDKASGYLDRIKQSELDGAYASYGVNPGDDPLIDKALQTANKAGLVMDAEFGGSRSAYGPGALEGSGASHRVVSQPSETYDNPEWLRLNNQFQDEQTMRTDAQSRNQQAYDWQRGAGMRNGMPGPEYSQPGFGAVNTAGGGEAGVSGAGNPAGVNMDWTGVYGGGNTGAVGMPSSQRRRWGV